MKTLLRPALLLLVLSLATPAALAQSGGGANIGGAANTTEGTGRGAGGPGDGEGPGQGAGQGLGPGGKQDKQQRDKAEREKKQREQEERAKQQRDKKEKADREKQERAKQEQEERERTQREKEERERTEKEKADREKQERDKQQQEERERAQREKEERERQAREDKEKSERDKTEREQKEREERQREQEERAKQEREQRERAEQEKADNEKKQREAEENRPKDEPARPEEKSTPQESSTPTEDKPPARPSEPTADPEPRRPEPAPRDNPVAPSGPSRTDIPAVPSRPDLPSVPSSPESFVPGGGRVNEALGGDPASTVNRFFGGLFGGGKKRAAEAAPVAVASGKNVIQADTAARARTRPAPFLGIFRPEFPNLVQAAKVRDVAVDSRVTSPRTVTYKSRLSRVSRWIGPLTLGLINYVPFETMNASVAGRINNLMAEEEISVEPLVARIFAEGLREKNRFILAKNPEAVFELELTRYALDPMPTSLGRVKPTVSVTGRLYNNNGQLLWIGKGFSTIAEKGLKGATVEQYEANPAQLRADFESAVRVAMARLIAQANAVPRASVKVIAAE